ncbi:inositol monophosphatase family protein [Variovorax sp. CF313]|uniref:inositol monophosphatase family protein n=1 Tax=Variovorax sp. CF313 TaxID=1144315 RepID=UPI0012F84976|nr:inositol monophosphatase [Variovorax sp. CF313]
MPEITKSDIDFIADVLVETGKSEIMPRFRRLSSVDTRRKSSAFDVVTEADEAAEDAIIACLSQRFGGAAFVGEESVEKEPGLFGALGSAPLAFVIDPLDGTRNFSAGVPLFGLMIAAVSNGKVIAGVIHDPVGGVTAHAVLGNGATLVDPGGSLRALQVAGSVPLSEMEGIAGTNFLPEPLRSRVNSNLSKVGTTNWFRCAAHEYVLAASGHCHFLFYNKLMPWDHAAGWLLHQEAGGYSAHFDGEPYRANRMTGGLLCAPDHQTWLSLREALLSE